MKLRSSFSVALVCGLFVLLQLQDGVEAGRGATKKDKRATKAGKAGKAGKAATGKDASPFGKIIDMLCGTPASPMNGGFSCVSTAKQMTCTGKCALGFQFPNRNDKMQLSCYPDGVWSPANKFPDCEAVCDPPCQNGGTCLGSNKCLCDRKFWGNSCEMPVSKCDITQVQSVVGYQCNRTNDVMTCTVNCPDGMEFESKPASQYTCTPYSSWQPPNIPGCQANNMIVHSLHSSNLKVVESGFMETVSGYRQAKNGMCVTWNQKHFQTFDGTIYSVEGKCTYLLAKDCNSNSFAIHMKMDKTCSGVQPCRPAIQLYMDNHRYELRQQAGKATLFQEDQQLTIPYAGNFFVEKISHYILVSSELGFTLIWDGKDGIQIEVTKALQNNTCGLCGSYDGFNNNDLKLADGSVTNDLLSFVNSWKMNAIGDVCHDPTYLHVTCNSVSMEREAAGMCQRILDPEYADCAHVIDPAPYIQACVNEHCACSKQQTDCGCRSVEAFFRECSRLNGPLKTNWRKNDFCPTTCPQGKEFHECGNTCPPTCQNPERECTDERCLDGCFCPQGTVRHGDECLPLEGCPCTFLGKEYKSKETVQQDCNTCMCFGGHWQCTKEKCEARCSSVGDPHYTTFDGKRYDFMGKCAYYLVAHTNFTIEQETVGCDGSLSKDLDFGMYVHDTSNQPSCTKWVTIRTHGTELQMKQNKALLLNGKEVSTLPTSAPGLYIYMASSTFVKAQLSNGMSVSWDGQSRVYVDAPPSLMGETQGLCGTFTLSQKDDFLTREGDIEHNINAFANKWKTEEFCHDMSVADATRDPCTIYNQRKDQAHKLCSTLHSAVFQHCHDFVDPDPFYHNCMYDMCSCQTQIEECLCPTIADYAAACTKIGVPVAWRDSVEQCHVTCPSGQVYQICGSSCRRSCFDIANNPNCHEQCVEGCNCPQGFTLDVEGHCIPVSQCMCLYDNLLYEPGSTEIRERQLCECSDARWKCRAASEEELLAKLREEPKPDLCSSNDNLEPTDCELLCPTTCANMHSPPHCPTSMCKPGCRCKSGYVLEMQSSKCVHPSHCPCHHGGRSYGEGETMQQDCNTCACIGGQWKCEKKSCPGTCTAWGDSHFNTFDGHMFEFLGDCEYTMAHGRIADNEYFTVNIQNKPCGTGHVACFKAVTITLEGEKLVLSKEHPLPRREETTLFIVREVGLFVVVHTPIGLTIFWDKGTRVYVKLDTKWQDKVEGLCGNFNDNELDDFRTPLGGPIVVRPSVFADSWKTHDQCSKALPVQDTCQLHAQRQSWAQQKCSVLKSEIFSSCHAEVPFEPYLERCISDACACDMGGDCECLCTAISAYAQECNIHGIPILWRSQDLCPIQCRTCDKYTSCMSVCPKKTCETEFLYAELEEPCKQEMCIEGCEPPMCSLDEVFVDDHEYKCIPRSECERQPCKVINGKMYHQGERVSDPKVADACQSCHCKDGALSCAGEACPPPEVSTAPPAVPPVTRQPVCTTTGWSEWINSYIPTYENGGDYERLSELITGPYELCPLDKIVAIECRTSGTLQHFQSTGQYLRCNLPEGLICENEDQQSSNKLCNDYEIRVFCSCEEPSTPKPGTLKPTIPPVRCTAPGWTPWMNAATPTSKGEIETIAAMRKKYTFCGASEIEDVDCREVASMTVHDPAIFPDVQCTKERGSVCQNGKGKDKKCTDFEVRFFCGCSKSDCDAARGMESGSIRDKRIKVSSVLSPNTPGAAARLHGAGAWSPKEIKPSEWIQVDLEELQEVTGIRTQGSPQNAEWVSSYKLMYSEDGSEWKTLQTKGNEVLLGNVDGNTMHENLFQAIEARYIRIVPVTWVNWISLRLEILGCNRLEVTPPVISLKPAEYSTTPMPTTIPATPFPAVCNTTGWTEWMNMDSPFSDEKFEVQNAKLGDNELVPQLRYSYAFCEEPSSILCRVAGTNQYAHTTGQQVDCDVSRGLECINSRQSNGACLNYEVSFYCECEGPAPSTTTVATTTPVGRVTKPFKCVKGSAGYTEWMNAVNPEDNVEGDVESFEALRSQYAFCEQQYISSMECRVVDERISFDQAGQYEVTCDVNHGFKCIHSQQPDGKCRDYEVRFYCHCLETVLPLTASPLPKNTPEAPVQVCNDWTRWYDRDTPFDEIEEERWSDIANFDTICPIPNAYECEEKETSKSYKLLDLRYAEACNSKGLVCQSDKDQYCPDFKIRAFCICEPIDVTPPPPTPPPGECVPGWTEWFNVDKPSSGGGDFERLDDLRNYYGFCSNELISDIECQSAPDDETPQVGVEISGDDDQVLIEPPRPVDFLKTGDKQVKCSRFTGLECYNSLQEPGKMCHDYRIRLFCACEAVQIATPVVTYTTPAPAVQICNDWTEWIDKDEPYDGYEAELFSSIPDFNQICPIVSEVECVEKYSELPYTHFGDVPLQESCTHRGIVCSDEVCPDYKIRAYCECEGVTTTVTTTTPLPCTDGWTEWFDNGNPTDGDGDYETMKDLRERYKFCSTDQITEVECKTKVPGSASLVDYSETGDVGVKCSKYVGLACYNTLQVNGKTCNDYSIRFHCSCALTTPATTAATPAPPCQPGFEWDNCAYRCDQMCHSFLKLSIKRGQCENMESRRCIPGCRNIRCDAPRMWINEQTCVPQTECTCLTDTGKTVSAGGEYNEDPCERCQCLRNNLICLTESGCKTKSTPKTTPPTTTATTPVGTVSPPCQPGYRWDNCAYRCDQMCHSFLKQSIKRGQCENMNSRRCIPGCRKIRCDAPRMWRDESTCVPQTECTCVSDSGTIVPAGGVYNEDPCEHCQCLHNNFICLTESGCKPTTTLLPPVVTPTTPVGTISPCPPGSVWDSCAYRCDQMCHSFLKLSISKGQCENAESHRCIPSCRKIRCDAPRMWRDEGTCVQQTECTCLTDNGKIVSAGDVYSLDPCESCRCLHNNLICLTESGCKPTPSPRPHVTGTTPVVSIVPPKIRPTTVTPPPPPINIEQEDCWTSWVNVDNPATGFGDFESIATIRSQYEFCGQPVKIECRQVTGQQSFDRVGQAGLKCDLQSGFVCQNQMNGKDGCYDYEVRFFCPCEYSTTPPSITTPPLPVVTKIGKCVQGYTEWFNSHKPSGAGEYESVASIRSKSNLFCDNEYITAIECRDKASGIYDSNLRSVVCNLQEGFHCRNSDQGKGKICPDYEVRFHCDCAEEGRSFFPTTTTPIPPVPTPLPPCDYWSRWINEDNSISGTGDDELMTAEQLSMKEGFCKQGEVTEIECFDVASNLPYQETGDSGVTCQVHEGLVCRNEYQTSGYCRDYKIRYFCSCGAAPSTTTVPPATFPPVRPCHEFVNLVEHLPDSNLYATSSLSHNQGPQSARLDSRVTSSNGGGWTAGDTNKNQYLQIDLGTVQPVYGIITQGHAVNYEWVKSYRVQFSNDGIVYSKVTNVDDGSVKTFTGNFDNVHASRNMFDPAFEARFVRIQPRTWERLISMRVELLGCAEITILTTPGITRMVTGIATLQTKIPLAYELEPQPNPPVYSPCCESMSSLVMCSTAPRLGVFPSYDGFLKGCKCKRISNAAPICTDSMGMQNMELVDGQITASSSHGPTQGPTRSRLGTKEADGMSGGWLSKQLNQNQYLQIDFTGPRTLTGIVTQGRDGRDQWITSYEVEFSNDGIVWNSVVDENYKVKIFAANIDSENPVTNYFPKSIRARYLRLRPKTWHNWISLRLEVKGCYEPYPEVTTIPEVWKQGTKTVPTVGYECTDVMGFENGKLSDDMIKVSSSKDGPRSDGSQLRLNTPEGAKTGGWVAGSIDDNQFVEIDFRDIRKLTGIEVQGRDETDEWVTKFLFLYSTDGITWKNATDSLGEKIFTGNKDSSSIETNMFKELISARYVRIVPLEWHNWISMRIELLGCFKPYPKVPVASTTPLPATTTPRPATTVTGFVCDEPMGLENGFVSDKQITVSSTLTGIHSGGPRIRLNTEETTNTGGWVAQVRNRNQYVQIDFLEPVNLTGIVTQGRDKYKEWVKTYGVSYSIDGNLWKIAYDENRREEFSGNKDEDTPVIHHFDKMLTARFVRIKPRSWNNWISMRLEVLGCYTGPVIQTTTPVPTTTTTITSTPSGECIEFGPWLNRGEPSIASDGDRERIEDLIAATNKCKYPIIIQCRDYVTHEDYGSTQQNVVCDLERGLVCKHKDQKTNHCYDYEARIGCYICPERNATLPPPVVLCPEVPFELARKCPSSCPTGQACDGRKCVSLHDCACYVEGKKFYPGDKIERKDCHECTCQLQGHSSCVPKVCPPCDPGLKTVLTSKCSCTCEGCPDGNILCPSSGECVRKDRWCDGIVDCPDDEVECVTATTPPPATTPKCPPVPACPPNTVLVTKNTKGPCPVYNCEIVPTTPTTPIPPPLPPVKATCDLTSNYFKTFDSTEYPYEICHHLLIQDKVKKSFNVTIHKKCSEDSKCTKFLVINQDSHRIRLGGNQIVEYNSREYTAKQLVRLGQSFHGFALRVVGNSVIFTSSKYGFQVEWDVNSNVRIEVDSKLLFKINGLCGYFSKDPADDMQKPNGGKASTVEEFGNSWATDSLELCRPQVCPPQIRKETMDVCNSLGKSPFKKCNSAIQPDYHIQICSASVCECMINGNLTIHECACQAFLPYVEACQKLSPQIEIEEWRFKKGCVPKCPPGLEWHDCGPACERTCENLYEDLEKCKEHSCVSGCFCPPGLVKKDDRCIEKEQCQDCICKGYGDPHYHTFDDFYYPFQGNCTYILARDRSPTSDHKFEVLATNEDCFEEPNTTCTVEIFVIYGGHMAHFKVNESVAFDGIQLYPSDFPFERYGINITITNPPGRTVTFRVESVHLEVRYFELNYGFEVRIPSEVYYNKTEGLCANCDYNKTNDIRHKDGYLTNDTDEFGLSWLASPPEGMESISDLCIVKPEVPCTSTVEKARCQKLLDEEFANCHLLVNPESYIKACEFDTCHSINPEASLCRSLTEYARECAQVGICMQHWRTDELCPSQCPEGMHFDQCGPACMHTCNNKDRYTRVAEECQLDKVEGCFCSGNRILRDGVCVDPIMCETCDLDDHRVGDTWNPNPCTTCNCNAEVKVQCTESVCPSRPVCQTGQFLQTIPADNSSCCETHICVLTPGPSCSEAHIPTCPPGQIADPQPDANNCTTYVCVCDVTKCPPVQEPVSLEVGQEVVLNKSGCCALKTVVCRPEKCPKKPVCEPPMIETKFDTHRCCPQYDCKPPPDNCAYEHNFRVDEKGIAHYVEQPEDREVKLYKPGESWKDGFCETCRCTGKRRGHYKEFCQGFMCPPPPDTKDYHTEMESMPNECCFKYKRILCRDGEKNYTIGQQWHPEKFDVCKKMQCISDSDGNAEKMEVQLTCQVKCKPNEKYVEPPSSDCCGHCEPAACIGMDDKVHQIGETWRIEHTCWEEKCILDKNDGIKNMVSNIKCPRLAENCPEDKIEKTEDDCCEICTVVPTPELCYPREVNLTDTIRMFDKLHNGQLCTNKKPIYNFTECFGKCESHSTFSSSKQEFVSSCHCCVPLATKKRTVMLECEDESKVPVEFKQPRTCMCNPCSNNEIIKNDLQLPGARQR